MEIDPPSGMALAELFSMRKKCSSISSWGRIDFRAFAAIFPPRPVNPATFVPAPYYQLERGRQHNVRLLRIEMLAVLLQLV